MQTRIKRIQIKNYRQYENLQLDLDDKKSVYVFVAQNSTGKSNFINALSWCLYGDEPLKSKDNTDSLLPYHLAVDPEKKHSRIEVSIEAELDEQRVIFKRSKVEIDSGHLDQNKFEVFLYVNGDWKAQTNPQYFVENFLPPFLRPFFMFDGESVKTTFERGYEANIKKNIHTVSYVTLIEETIKHVGTILQETRRDAGRLNPEIDGVMDQINQIEQQLLTDEKELKEKKSVLASRDEKIKEMEAQQSAIEKHRAIVEKKREITESIRREDEHLANYESNYKHLLGRLAPFAYLYKELGAFSLELAKLEANGEIPPKVTSEFVEGLMGKKNSGKCICGHDIDADAVKAFNLLLEEIKRSESKGFLVKSNNNLAHINREIQNSYSSLRDLKENIIKTNENIDCLLKEEKEISKQLSDKGEDIGTLEDTIRRYKEEAKSLERDIWSLEQSIKTGLTTKDDLNKKQLENTANVEKLKFVNAKIKTLELIEEKYRELLVKNVQTTRQALSGTMKDFFKKLFWREDYLDIFLNEDYEIVVMKDVNGVATKQPISALSSGERASLGYSLIKGLAELSGFKQVPVFIDGPISDLDEGTATNFLEVLPNFMKEKQLFVFFKTDKGLVEPYISKHLDVMEAFRLERPSKYGPTVIKDWGNV